MTRVTYMDKSKKVLYLVAAVVVIVLALIVRLLTALILGIK